MHRPCPPRHCLIIPTPTPPPWWSCSQSLPADSPAVSSLSQLRSLRDSLWPKRLFKMALAIGSIMAVEAVLLSHMDRNEVVAIIPRMSLGTEGVRGRSRTRAPGPRLHPTCLQKESQGLARMSQWPMETKSTHRAYSSS